MEWGPSLYYVHKIFRKTNISYTLIHKRFSKKISFIINRWPMSKVFYKANLYFICHDCKFLVITKCGRLLLFNHWLIFCFWDACNWTQRGYLIRIAKDEFKTTRCYHYIFIKTRNDLWQRFKCRTKKFTTFSGPLCLLFLSKVKIDDLIARFPANQFEVAADYHSNQSFILK